MQIFGEEEQSQVTSIHILHYLFKLRTNLLGIESGSKNAVKQQEKHEKMHNKSIEEVLKHCTNSQMAIDCVEGTAIGLYKGKLCIKVFSSVKLQKLQGKIPSSVEGYPVVIEETGTFRALYRQ